MTPEHIAHNVFNLIKLNNLENATQTEIVNFICQKSPLSDHCTGNEIRAAVKAAMEKIWPGAEPKGEDDWLDDFNNPASRHHY